MNQRKECTVTILTKENREKDDDSIYVSNNGIIHVNTEEEKYNITMLYKGDTITVNNKELYEKYDIGDEVQVLLQINYRNNNPSYEFAGIKEEGTIYNLEVNGKTKSFNVINKEERNKYTYYYTDDGYRIDVKKDNSSCDIYDTLTNKTIEKYHEFNLESSKIIEKTEDFSL